ncbi:hypothetical protein [Pyrolobus fumarii]|uniref:hypothetical protein n=1 Tax=Pyrolobus fumarii TaxID=54252 RepID=UPI0014328697|nr:hypothetical protein [Pyrolobus fumarii]
MSIPVPDRLAGYPLLRLVSGDEALRMVKGIHWEPGAIPASGAAVALYGINDKVAYRLWIVEVSNACLAVESMAKKIAEYSNQLPYTPPQPHNYGSVTFYITLDRRNGSYHIFWCEGSYALWLEAYDTSTLMKAVEQLIEFYGSHG